MDLLNFSNFGPLTNKKVKNIAQNYLSGRLKFAQFALTNACMAKCSFCSIWKQQPKVYVDKEKALAAIDRMADLGVSHITFTGGDPLLHREMPSFIKKATERNIHSIVLNAAPQLILRRELKNYRPGDYVIKQLEEAGLDLIAISFDSGDPETMAEQRQLPNIVADMEHAMRVLKQTKIKTAACVLIWDDNYDKIENVCERATNMGFDLICFNYPTFSQSDVYPLGGRWLRLSNENVILGLEKVIDLKKQKRYNIANQVDSMQNIIDYLTDPALAKFPCFGGGHTLFVDWNFDVHPCMQLPDRLGNIFEIKEEDLERPSCNSCNMSWYRDLSMYFNGERSLPLIMSAVKDALGSLTHD